MNEHQTPNEDDSPDEFLFLWACGFELAIGVLALVLAGILGIEARAYLPKWEELDPVALSKQSVIGVLAAVPPLIAVHLFLKLKHPAIEKLHRLSDAPMMKALLALSLPELIVLSLCAGIGEELAFRGFLLPWIASLDGLLGGESSSFQIGESFAQASPLLVAIALMISSIAFGLVHPITKVYIAIATVMGLYLGILFLVTESLLVAIIAHGAYDAFQFMLAKREESEVEETIHPDESG